MSKKYQSGFVSIFGAPNAGKSTLTNALTDEHLAIVSPKVQTTRHRILGFITGENYQIVLSDTPGIIEPRYKLHSKMMKQVQFALEDTDVALLLFDAGDDVENFINLIEPLRIKAPKILLINKIDTAKSQDALKEKAAKIEAKLKPEITLMISALEKINTDGVVQAILQYLPENPPFYPEDDISDRPIRFFVSEMIREQIYYLYENEIPYHAAVMVQSYEDLPHIARIKADVIVNRESQKIILIGKKGEKIKQLSTRSRESIEAFIGKKVYLELFVKVRPKWRDNDIYLKEYGY